MWSRPAAAMMLAMIIAAGVLGAPVSPLPGAVATLPSQAQAVVQQLEPLFGRGNNWGYVLDKTETRIAKMVVNLPDGMPKGLGDLEAIIEGTKSLHGLNRAEFGQPVKEQIGSIKRVTIPQMIDGKPVENANLLVEIDEAIRRVEIIIQTVRPQNVIAARTAEEAKSIALLELRRDAGLEAPNGTSCASPELSAVQRPPLTTRYLSDGTTAYEVYHFDATAKCGGRTLALFEYDVSTSNPPAIAIVRKLNRIHRVLNGVGRVFDPSPLVIQNRASIAAGAVGPRDASYHTATLTGIDDASVGAPLGGPLVDFVDIEGEDVPRPKPTSFRMGRPQYRYVRTDGPPFASVMVFYHLTALAETLASLAMKDVTITRIDVDVLSNPKNVARPRSAIDSCEFRAPLSGSADDGVLMFGEFSPTLGVTMSGAEDGEIIAHEFGHILLSKHASGYYSVESAGAFGGSEAGAISEGFADFWAMSSFFDKKKKACYDPHCFAAWGSASPGVCMRVVGRFETIGQAQAAGQCTGPHDCGQVWSGVLAEIFEKVFPDDHAYAQTVILQGHLSAIGHGGAPTMALVAETILSAAGDRHRQALCDVFNRHAVAPTSCGDLQRCMFRPPP